MELQHSTLCAIFSLLRPAANSLLLVFHVHIGREGFDLKPLCNCRSDVKVVSLKCSMQHYIA